MVDDVILKTVQDFLVVCVCVCCSVMSNPFVTPWTVARQGSLSMECSRQEFYTG